MDARRSTTACLSERRAAASGADFAAMVVGYDEQRGLVWSGSEDLGVRP